MNIASQIDSKVDLMSKDEHGSTQDIQHFRIRSQGMGSVPRGTTNHTERSEIDHYMSPKTMDVAALDTDHENMA